MTFFNTLYATYYDKLVKNATKKFIDFVLSSEMINAIITSGRMFMGESFWSGKKPATNKKKEKEANTISYTDPS